MKKKGKKKEFLNEPAPGGNDEGWLDMKTSQYRRASDIGEQPYYWWQGIGSTVGGSVSIKVYNVVHNGDNVVHNGKNVIYLLTE